MARFREYSYDQAVMLPVALGQQLQPGSFEYAINYLVDHCIDRSVFEQRYANDETGAPAIDPAILLKIVLFAYSRGILSSRAIARACEENVIFMALSADTRPHFTTIANFISCMDEAVVGLFRDVLTICYAEGLIGRQMFAIDGCKISSNCAKEWSGTKKELLKKAEKIERSIESLVQRHREEDERQIRSESRESEEQKLATLKKKAEKIISWTAENDDRIGRRGKPVKSNLTDNESAKLVSSHGVIQGYNGIATVDAKHQIVVDAQAFGDVHEAAHVKEIIESVETTFSFIDPEKRPFESVVVTADSGFSSEEAVAAVLDAEIDAYIADPQFRKRDPRFADQQKHKAKTTDRKQTSKARKYFTAEEFTFNDEGILICPAGKPMKSSCPNWKSRKGYTGRTFKGYPEHCGNCPVRDRCLRNPNSPVRQVTKTDPGMRHNKKSAVQQMMERFDTERGRHYYSRRMGIVEPVFGNTRATLGMDRFTLRGRSKVDAQWKLFCIVHNIGKLARYGPSFAGATV
jgi:transposase